MDTAIGVVRGAACPAFERCDVAADQCVGSVGDTVRGRTPVLIPALREIKSVIDRFAPPRPSRAAVFGLVIRLGKAAADVMKRDPFRSVDPDHKVHGWDYDHAAQYADLVGIPAGAEVRATAAVRHLWPQGPAGVAHRDGSRYRRHGGQAVGRSSGTRRAPGVDGRPGGMARGRGGGAIYRERDTQEDGFWGDSPSSLMLVR